MTYSKLPYLKSSSPGQFLGLSQMSVTFQNYLWLLYYFYFERNYDVLKSKSPCFLLNKNINFNKNKTELKLEESTQFQSDKLCAFPD